MRLQRTRAEIEQIRHLLLSEETFHKVFQNDFTDDVLDDLRNRLFGKIPRNFVVNITGLIGLVTGCFKSSMGLQLAFYLDPSFSISQRVSFSVNELLDKIRKNTEFVFCNQCYFNFIKSYKYTYEVLESNDSEKCDNCDNVANKQILLTKLIFFLDEQTKTLKQGGLIRLMNIVDTARQRQICFICCGVEGFDLSFTTYTLKRIQETNDDYLPIKKVRYAVWDETRKIFYGFFRWNITPLTDAFWNKVWNEYSLMKTNFQRVALAQQTQQLNLEEYAEDIINSDDFLKCFKVTQTGKKVLQTGILRNLIYQKFSDFTEGERNMILNQIKMDLYSDKSEDEEDGEE